MSHQEFKQYAIGNGRIAAHSCLRRMKHSMTLRLPAGVDRCDIGITEDETPHGGAPALPEGTRP
jgi:hypothetical protein